MMDFLQALVQSVLLGLISPTVILPAIAIGLVARRWRQVIVATLVLVAVLLTISLSQLLPGAIMAWEIAPIAIVAPLAWASATFALRRWMGRREPAGGNSSAKRVVALLLGLVLGAIGGGAIAVGIGVLWVDVFEVSHFEGGAGYLIFLLFLPLGILIGAPLGAFLGWHLARPRPAIAPP